MSRPTMTVAKLIANLAATVAEDPAFANAEVRLHIPDADEDAGIVRCFVGTDLDEDNNETPIVLVGTE